MQRNGSLTSQNDVCQIHVTMQPHSIHYLHRDHSPDNVKFRDISLTVHGTPVHVKCYSCHAGTSVIVSGGGRNTTVHDPKPK